MKRTLTPEPEVGFYRFKATKHAPWQPCRIMQESGLWVVLVNGEVASGSGCSDPFDIPLLLNRWPLHPITEKDYDALIQEHATAPQGHPLRTPGERVNLRAAAPLYGRKT